MPATANTKKFILLTAMEHTEYGAEKKQSLEVETERQLGVAGEHPRELGRELHEARNLGRAGRRVGRVAKAKPGLDALDDGLVAASLFAQVGLEHLARRAAGDCEAWALQAVRSGRGPVGSPEVLK